MADNASIRSMARDIVAKTRRKIEAGTNGDVEGDLLILASANFEDIQDIKANPMVKFGQFMKDFPALAYPFILGSFIVLFVSSLLLVAGVLDKLGLALVPIATIVP